MMPVALAELPLAVDTVRRQAAPQGRTALRGPQQRYAAFRIPRSHTGYRMPEAVAVTRLGQRHTWLYGVKKLRRR